MTVRFDPLTVDWLGYATVRLEAQTGAVVYMDPGRYGVLDDYDARDGDLVLVTHDHHYDPDGIRRVAREDALVVVYEEVDADRIDRDVEPPEDLPYTVERVGTDEVFAVGALDLFTTPAYNHPDGRNVRDGEPIHPEGFGCGFAVTMDGVTAFWPGDSDVLEYHTEMEVDLFVPSIASNYTMNRHEAADLAETLDPRLVVPVHYDTFEALEADAEAFAVDVATRGIPVALETPEQ
ncbi:MBL fold metallo-hydrolase [Natronobiforma cellulositropha]|uniref:MBL fold metallo-hydrolase n=1 Tax=Natronobiforma cellulositropha TaxID=1679076 RepID=UPI0021D5CCA3|nr:MBL fold metallo-hydrolase [Natronobiforma cellulositropha]